MDESLTRFEAVHVLQQFGVEVGLVASGVVLVLVGLGFLRLEHRVFHFDILFEFHGLVDDWGVLVVVWLRSDDVADSVSPELFLVVRLGRRFCHPCAVDNRHWLAIFSLPVGGVDFFVCSVMSGVEWLVLLKFVSWGRSVVVAIFEGVPE